MQAIIETGGKQYQVAKGDRLKVNLLKQDVGATLDLDCLAILDDKNNQFGEPKLTGVKVVAKVLEHLRGPKLIVSKFKRRKGYQRKQGHRQELTHLEIAEIQAS